MTESPKVVVAECPACGNRRFRGERDALEADDVLTCESCGLKLSYAFLQSRMEKPRPAKRKAAKRPKRKSARRR